MRGDVLAAIMGMAVVTYAVRAGGLWLMGRVTPGPRLDSWLGQIPGDTLAALVVPAALSSGPAGLFALLATVGVAARTRNVLLAMLTGVGCIWLMRRLF